MKISELEKILYIGRLDYKNICEQSQLIANYQLTSVDNPVTKTISPHIFGQLIAADIGLTVLHPTNAYQVCSLTAGSTAWQFKPEGYLLSSTANNVMTSLVAGYTDTDYPEETSDWNAYYIKQITNTSGALQATHALFSPAITWHDAVSGTNDSKPTLSISIAGNTSTSVTPNIATTAVYGVTLLSNAIDSTSEVLAATPKAVKDAIESLDITAITNTAGKTVASITEADGKVGATFQDISITSSQISDKGTAGNVATLDENGHVPASQLPSYVDDVLEGTLATFPATGESGKIYVDTTTNTSYRWSGSQYTKVASDLSLGETSSTAYRGDYGAAAYAHGVTNKGSAFTSNLYKITTNSEGHVTAAIAVTSTDITNLFGKAIVLTDDSRLSDARNAADVSAWAKAATKPTYTASEVGAVEPSLIDALLDNFDIKLSLPDTVNWAVDETTGALSATVNNYVSSTTVIIQKQVGDNWETYDDSARTEGEHYRAYATRTFSFNSRTYTTSGIIGTEYIEPAAE